LKTYKLTTIQDKQKIGRAKVALSKWKSAQKKDPMSALYSEEGEEPWAKGNYRQRLTES
jgi:hypothetical protein